MTEPKTSSHASIHRTPELSHPCQVQHTPTVSDSASTTVTKTQWFAIYTRSRFEKKLASALQKANDLTVFLPLIKERRVWSDRIKTVYVPLLPSYVFVKMTTCRIRELYYYPGFVRVVSQEGKPCAIKEKEIELLERIVSHGFPVEKAQGCQVGDWVRIVRGPLQGWEGRVDSKKGASRIVFHFECLQQAISVEVDLGDVEGVD